MLDPVCQNPEEREQLSPHLGMAPQDGRAFFEQRVLRGNLVDDGGDEHAKETVLHLRGDLAPAPAEYSCWRKRVGLSVGRSIRSVSTAGTSMPSLKRSTEKTTLIPQAFLDVQSGKFEPIPG